jgi:hypothetical protein
MKSTFPFLRATFLAAALLGVSGAVAQSQHTTSSGSSVSVSTVNGQSVVTLNGKEIYKGPASGAVSSRSRKVNGVEYSVVYDGDKLLWESSPGAAQQIGSAAATGGSPGVSGSSGYSFSSGSSGSSGGKASGTQPAPGLANPNAHSGVSIKTVNGSSVVVYNGQEVFSGPTRGKVSAKSKSVNGKDYAAAFDDDGVVWENVPGAAAQLK